MPNRLPDALTNDSPFAAAFNAYCEDPSMVDALAPEDREEYAQLADANVDVCSRLQLAPEDQPAVGWLESFAASLRDYDRPSYVRRASLMTTLDQQRDTVIALAEEHRAAQALFTRKARAARSPYMTALAKLTTSLAKDVDVARGELHNRSDYSR